MKTRILLCLAPLGACVQLDLEPGTFWDGYTVFFNGTIYTDPFEEPVGSLLVDPAGLVQGAGFELDPAARADLERVGFRLVDLRGGTAIPGLQDAHGHVSGLGAALEEVDLVGSTSYAEVIERIAARAAREPAGTWITGRGWDQTRWPENAFPDHGALSRAVPDHPVLVRRVDGHAALANARALELAALLGAEPVPEIEGGRVLVDESGRVTGVLIDTAMGLVARHVPEGGREQLRRRILLAQDALLAQGLVCVHDMGIDPEEAELYAQLDARGELKLRLISYLYGNGGIAPEVARRFPRAEDLDPASKLRILGAKLMMDGALGSRGAALLAPYADAPREVGLLRMSAEDFARRVDAVVAAGLQPATHAIGDRANRIVLDVYAERLAADPSFAALRPRVEHAQIVSAADWSRFDDLGIVASMQPTHATSDMRWAEARVGPDRVRGAYAWRRLTADPRRLAFGSDFPVEHPSPLAGLYAARTRTDEDGSPSGGWLPDQRLDAREAVAAFTQGAAWAAREETSRGKLVEGFACDMTVLSVDPIRCSPAELLSAEVLFTVVDGEVVYARGHHQ